MTTLTLALLTSLVLTVGLAIHLWLTLKRTRTYLTGMHRSLALEYWEACNERDSANRTLRQTAAALRDSEAQVESMRSTNATQRATNTTQAQRIKDLENRTHTFTDAWTAIVEGRPVTEEVARRLGLSLSTVRANITLPPTHFAGMTDPQREAAVQAAIEKAKHDLCVNLKQYVHVLPPQSYSSGQVKFTILAQINNPTIGSRTAMLPGLPVRGGTPHA